MSTSAAKGPKRGSEARAVALDALLRIEDGAYANLALPALLDRSPLPERDRHLVTELVYGVTRMRRACDHLIAPFTRRPLDTPTRTALRLGTYQLHLLRVPAHAAVSATVDVAPARSRGLVNAVLRKVATAPVTWPDVATRLSYPDWIVDRLTADLGEADAVAALEAMNEAPPVHQRADGYTQDPASQQVAAAVGARPGERVADLCAGPGGKATAMAATGALVLASDRTAARTALVAANAERTGTSAHVRTVVADGRRPPWHPGSLDRALVDAPCSGLGVLRRRPDARWRIEPDAISRLAHLQRQLLDGAALGLRPGGTLVYSVCTLTDEETLGVDRWLADAHPELEAVAPPGPPWRAHGRGARLLPQDEGTDGMYTLILRRTVQD